MRSAAQPACFAHDCCAKATVERQKAQMVENGLRLEALRLERLDVLDSGMDVRPPVAPQRHVARYTRQTRRTSLGRVGAAIYRAAGAR